MATEEDGIRLRQRVFIDYYLAEYGNITKAAKRTGIDRGTYYLWLEDPTFAAALKEAVEVWTEELEATGRRRAIRESDDLLKFFLKAANREKYDEAIAKLKYQKDHDLPPDEERGPVRVILERGKSPQRGPKAGDEEQ